MVGENIKYFIMKTLKSINNRFPTLKGIQTPEEMVGPRDEAESERGKVMGINLFSGYGYVYAIVYHRLKDIRI